MKSARRCATPFPLTVAVWISTACVPHAAYADQPLEPAVETSFKNGPDLDIRVRVLTVDPTEVNVRIVSVPLELGSEPGSGDHSLRRYAEHLESKVRRKVKSWAVVNGGFSSSREDIPVGLLIVDGKVYSRLDKTVGKGSTASSDSAYSKYRWSGVLCQSKEGGSWDIIPAAKYEPKKCHQALQAGPMLVEPGRNVAISEKEPKLNRPYARTVVCLAGSQLKFLVVQDEIHLLPLAKWLITGKSKGGPGCNVAMNLSGDSSSGMAQRQVNRKGVEFFGDGTFPIPSAVLIEARDR